MRVAVFGYQSWGRRALSAVISAGHQAVLVVAHPACDHLYQQMWAYPVDELASEQGVQVPSAHVSQVRFGGTLAESPSLTREESRWSADRALPTCQHRRLFWHVCVSTTTRNCPRPKPITTEKNDT
ncbi:hypothetical protein NLL30_01115 [Corynebacterium propinquum]|uniref:hypothetical protein n=1 Tax=Corynebacterium propinquum TaxID=43769 RepID=UPI00266EC58F|nr:hypothetical protein [Corynebacterium propinquum]WKS36571.1 hypothetical protein NLL30_01115 [Corynebacterium propinquum]WKS42856.1 hypothetical protein NLL42_00015 [Corynebacterium propinquum]